MLRRDKIPPKQNAEFVAKMEDILEVYALPYDENYPVVCMDEQPVQLLGDKLEPLPMKPCNTAKEDYQYIRGGVCSIFIFTEPLAAWRHVHASERRTKVDWALHIQELLDVHYPNAKKIRLLMDNKLSFAQYTLTIYLRYMKRSRRRSR